uniref:DUF7745 domain-containing protein n=1 Tax=Fagus sylvatica TaxID=28930 RepID=A0A2N9G964_FAGSY
MARLRALPRGILIHPRQQLLESSSVSVRVSFLTRFSRAVLEVFRNSKWVMRHIVGKLSTSSFQRYKVCANRSSDERVMAPGSRGVGAVFVHFSDEDSGQTGDAIGEPRVPRRSWSRYLSNAPGLADQLVASRKDSAREGGSPDVGFRRSWYRWKACAAYFCKVPDLRKSELGLVRYGPANRGHRSVFGPFEGSFPIRIPARPDQLVASQEDSARKRGNVGGKIPEFSAKPYFVGLFSRAWPCTEASLGSQDMILRTEAVGMFLMPRGHLLIEIPALTGGALDDPKVAHWGGQFDLAFGPVNGLVKPWSNLVNLGQSPPNFGKWIPDHILRFVSIYVPALPGSKWIFRGLRKIGRGAGRQFVARKARLVRRTPIDDQFSPTRPTGKYLSIPTLLFSFERCPIGVVVAEIIASPHALDSCECMNIKDAMRALSRWLLLCLLGQSALTSHTLGLAISVELGFRGRFFTFKPGSRLLGHPCWRKIDPVHVTLRFHDFRVERMRHWWTLLGEDDHADIVGIFGKFPPFMRLQVDRGLLEALASFWDPTHCCFSIGEVDLVPTLEEYAELLQLDSPFSETPVIPIQGPRSNRCLEKYLGLTTAVLRPEITRPEETWRKANIPLGFANEVLLSGVTFQGSLLGTSLQARRDGRNSESTPSRLPSQVYHPCHIVRDRAVFVLLQGDRERGFRCSAHSSSSFGSAVTCGISTASRPLITLRGIRGWAWKVTWGPAAWMPWTHCALFDGVPLPGVWGCTGYYPSLALRQFGGVQYPPRLGDLDAVTFDYIPGEDMWRLLFRIEDIWGGRLSEMVLIEEGSPGDSSVTSDFVEWREGWTPFFTLRPTIRPGASYSLVSRSLRVSASTGQPERVTVLERELEEARAELASLRLARASEREESAARVESMRSTLHHNSVAVANLRRDLELEISEAAKDHMEETLTETQGQLETEQVERTRVQDELDSLRSYTQALVDPATGRPHDIVALRRALDESEAALTSARTSIGAMRVQISVLQGDNGVLQTELDLVHDALESECFLAQPGGFPRGHCSSSD